MWYIARTLLGLILRRPLVGVRAIPFLPDGRVVLVRLQRGGWVLPGGLVDHNEKLHTALDRELQEECGVRVERFGRLCGVYSEPWRDVRFHSVCVVIEVFVQGTLGTSDPQEIREVAAFALDALPEELLVDCRTQLAQYLAGEVVVD